MTTGPAVTGALTSAAADLPGWLAPLVRVAATARVEDLAMIAPPRNGGRTSAILLLFWQDEAEQTRVLLIERSRRLRSHAGQPAFPGGAVDATDAGPAAAAVREAVEETGLDPAGVEVFATLPDLWVPVSGFVVTPVLAWWRAPGPVGPADPAEVEAVHRVRVADLLDPANRSLVRHPSGYTSPGFRVNGMLVWGFTAGVLDRLLRLAGWERPWPAERVEDLSGDALRLAQRTSSPDEPA